MKQGKIGLAYLKKGARLNGTVVETIEIESERNPPELLNKYLLVRGRTLKVKITYCVANIQFLYDRYATFICEC